MRPTHKKRGQADRAFARRPAHLSPPQPHSPTTLPLPGPSCGRRLQADGPRRHPTRPLEVGPAGRAGAAVAGSCPRCRRQRGRPSPRLRLGRSVQHAGLCACAWRGGGRRVDRVVVVPGNQRDGCTQRRCRLPGPARVGRARQPGVVQRAGGGKRGGWHEQGAEGGDAPAGCAGRGAARAEWGWWGWWCGATVAIHDRRCCCCSRCAGASAGAAAEGGTGAGAAGHDATAAAAASNDAAPAAAAAGHDAAPAAAAAGHGAAPAAAAATGHDATPTAAPLRRAQKEAGRSHAGAGAVAGGHRTCPCGRAPAAAAVAVPGRAAVATTCRTPLPPQPPAPAPSATPRPTIFAPSGAAATAGAAVPVTLTLRLAGAEGAPLDAPAARAALSAAVSQAATEVGLAVDDAQVLDVQVREREEEGRVSRERSVSVVCHFHETIN